MHPNYDQDGFTIRGLPGNQTVSFGASGTTGSNSGDVKVVRLADGTTKVITNSEYKELVNSGIPEESAEVFFKNAINDYNRTPNRDVNLRITNEIVGAARVHPFPINNGDIYQVPLYKVVLSGKNAKGKEVSRDFKALRFGVSLYKKDGKPKLVGLMDAQSYLAKWDYSAMGNNGAWRIFDNYLIHYGVQYLTSSQGNLGCTAICGRVNVNGKTYGAWNYFTKLVEFISGDNNYKHVDINVTYDEVKAKNRPKLKKI